MQERVVTRVVDFCFWHGQSQFTDMVGGKPLGLTIAWINRRGVDLHPSVPRPDFIFADIASLVPLLDGRAIRNG